jgi:DNA end-binding protein Ku
MARAIWSGSISFGLLNVPVKLYSAVARRGISLREIRESDGARIRHRRVAEGTDEEVPYEKIQKAFEITSGNYVPISKDEIAALAPKISRAIYVQDFVGLDEIDPIYFDSPYYLGPAEGAEKAYSLLASAMEGSGKVAISRFVFRNKEHLAALRSENGVLTLTTMRFADEVVPPSELDDVLPGE